MVACPMKERVVSLGNQDPMLCAIVDPLCTALSRGFAQAACCCPGRVPAGRAIIRILNSNRFCTRQKQFAANWAEKNAESMRSALLRNRGDQARISDSSCVSWAHDVSWTYNPHLEQMERPQTLGTNAVRSKREQYP